MRFLNEQFNIQKGGNFKLKGGLRTTPNPN